MAGGNYPGPINDLGPPVGIDGGTLARAEMPLPGPIGLQAGGGATGPTDLGAKVVSYARGKIGKKAGDGQCFALVDRALRDAGAKSAADFGKVTPDADYVWGNAVGLADVRPGDIIQFRNYRYDRTIKTESKTEIRTDTEFQERQHHTAIIESVDGNGAITVLEQNVPDGGSGQRNQLFFSKFDSTSGGKTTTIKVKGRFRFYRPQPR